MTDDFKSNCLVCEQPLIYINEYSQFSCALCGKNYDSQISCSSGHFVCDLCQESSAYDLIEKVCVQTDSTQPVELAISLMKSPAIKITGAEHHFLVPAVLLAACYNKLNKSEEKERKIRLARKRAENILSDFCGFYGACGAGIGTGIFMALYTDSDPHAREQWGLSNLMTAESLRCIGALGGPRCCKRNTFLALKSAVKFLKQIYSVHLDITHTITCDFSNQYRLCIEEDCPFYQKVSIH